MGVPRRKILVRVTAATRYVRRRRNAVALAISALLVMTAALAVMPPDSRMLAAPAAVMAEVTLVFMLVLWVRDGVPPVFESGTLCALANAAYGILPLVGFVLMHGRWDPLADSRLQDYPFDGRELAMFGWRYALYAASFAAAYLVVRGRAAVKTTAFVVPSPDMQAATIAIFFALEGTRILLKVVWGYDPLSSEAYADLAKAAEVLNSKPYIVRMVGHNIIGALFVMQQAMVLLLLALWRKRWCRWALAMWLGWEIASTAIKLGSRSTVVLLLITAGVTYHRLVKAVTFRTFVFAGAALLTAFLAVGVLRARQSQTPTTYNFITSANEFQGLFTTAFDIHKKKEAGEIPAVPWQVYVSDFYMPVPSTLLPFEKIDPSTWYIGLIGQTGKGVGYMFGVMSQAVLGLDWLELVLRGAVLAVFLAMVQRWYVRHALHFWPTLFFLFVSIWTYTTFRASTFYFLYFVIYHFVPVALAAQLLATLLRRVRPRPAAPERAAA
jgi:hypothetical protein